MKALSISVLAAALVLPAAAAADEVMISGTIFIESRPSPSQTVTFQPLDGGVTYPRVAVTDEFGHFIARLPAGRYLVQFGDFCESTPYKLELAVPEVQRIDIRLGPKNPEETCVYPHAAEDPKGV